LLLAAFIRRTNFFLSAAMLELLKMASPADGELAHRGQHLFLTLDDDVASDVWAEAKDIGGQSSIRRLARILDKENVRA
jgi:hypothetical protein